jgi:hypothetical protein
MSNTTPEVFNDPATTSKEKKVRSWCIQYNRQINLYIKQDPKPKQRVALLIKVFEFIMKSTLDPVSLAKAKLTTSALFYGMRSYEFVKVPVASRRTTKDTISRSQRYMLFELKE